MFKGLLVVGGLAALVGGTVGLETAGEVGQVMANRFTEGVKGSIPVEVEIERLELLLTKVEREASRNTHAVARAQIALEDALASKEQAESWAAGCKQKLARLRSLDADEEGRVQLGCQTVSYEAVRLSMARQVSAWKANRATCAAHEKTVAALQAACDNLTAKHEAWTARRDQLKTTLETLRARQTALAATTDAPTSGVVVELDRAQELASSIERRLRIAEREEALGQGIGIDALSAGEIDADPADMNVEADVDAILGIDSKVAGR